MRRGLVAALVCVCATPSALAGDVTLFAARVSPAERWATAYGASLTSTWFHVINLEAEAARHPGKVSDEIMTTFTGSAFIAPTIGRFVPYGGPGIGFFRQSRGDRSETGWVKSFAVGAKLKLGVLLIRGEWRRVNLSGESLIEIDSRVSAGVGVTF